MSQDVTHKRKAPSPRTSTKKNSVQSADSLAVNPRKRKAQPPDYEEATPSAKKKHISNQNEDNEP